MVSVIMPAYNGEKFIGKAIDSILCQTYTDLELLIIDDCSTDHTLEIIKSYDDKRIRIFTNTVNRGIAYSTNLGLRQSKGEYIALLDDDDIAVKDRLEIQVQYLEKHTNIDILGGRSVIIDENDNYIRMEEEPRNNPRYLRALLLFKRVDFRNGTTMMRSSFISKHGFCYQEGCFGMQDYRFFIDSSKVGNLSSVNKVLLYYRVNSMNTTNKEKKKKRAERAEKYFEFQKYSLTMSGYCLNDSSLCLIRKLFSEEGSVCQDYTEFRELVNVFVELLRQAREMNVDYYNELEHLCKVLVAEQAIKMKNFTTELFLGFEK